MASSSEPSSSSGDDSEDVHPLDAAVQKRNQNPIAAQEQQQRPIKRKRSSPIQEVYASRWTEKPDASSPESGELPDTNNNNFDDDLPSSDDEADNSDGSLPDTDIDNGDDTTKRSTPDHEQKKRKKLVVTTKNTTTPAGVVIYQEGQKPETNPEMQRLLRIPRYFDQDFDGGSHQTCFRCGGRGHMARDCAAPPKPRPCFLCAEFGHDSRDCPNSLCWKCQRSGHMARDCPYKNKKIDKWNASAAVCLRCGRQECPCAGESDHLRAEGGCTNAYLESDLKNARCFNCHKFGHLSCTVGLQLDKIKASNKSATAKLSCYNCGEGGHVADDCWKEKPQVIQAERRFNGSKQQQKKQQSSSYLHKGNNSKTYFYEDDDDDDYEYARRSSGYRRDRHYDDYRYEAYERLSDKRNDYSRNRSYDGYEEDYNGGGGNKRYKNRR